MSATTAAASPAPIRALDPTVVQRIAAGEVIQRPANAVKELLENALDAGATTISVSVKGGGMKQFQIVDNGHGIRCADFAILCQRHTTSKLTSFDDLRSIATFGFRGEALSSITHVAHVNITSRTAASKCAFRARYVQSQMLEYSGKQAPTSKPQPCAGNVGTSIVVEDLFFNVPQRKSALSNEAAEYKKIVRVVQQYALHNAGVSFTLKRTDSGSLRKADVATPTGCSQLSCIRLLWSDAVARELVELTHDAPALRIRMRGYVSRANAGIKGSSGTTFIVFINGRLVHCNALKRATRDVYSRYLAKGGHAWVYVALQLHPSDVDVNVHPTKREVLLMHEQQVVDEWSRALQATIGVDDVSRAFDAPTSGAPVFAMGDGSRIPLPRSSSQTTTTPSGVRAASAFRGGGGGGGASSTSWMAEDTPEYQMVRTDSRQPTLHSFAAPPASQSVSHRDAVARFGSQQPAVDPAMGGPSPRPAPLPVSPSSSPSTGSSPLGTPSHKHDTSVSMLGGKRVRRHSWDDGRESENDGDGCSDACEEGKHCTHHHHHYGAAQGDTPKAKRMTTLQALDQRPYVMQPPPSLAGASVDDEASSEHDGSGGGGGGAPGRQRRRRRDLASSWHACELESVIQLRAEVDERCHEGLRALFRCHTWVGCLNANQVLVQYETSLYLVNAVSLSRHLMYERVLNAFARVRTLPLTPPVALVHLIRLGLQHGGGDLLGRGGGDDDGDDDQVAPSDMEDVILTTLSDTNRREMLRLYFGVVINEEPALVALPKLVSKYVPDMTYLPYFIVRLVSHVSYADEKACLHAIAQQIARFYAVPWQHEDADGECDAEQPMQQRGRESQAKGTRSAGYDDACSGDAMDVAVGDADDDDDGDESDGDANDGGGDAADNGDGVTGMDRLNRAIAVPGRVTTSNERAWLLQYRVFTEAKRCFRPPRQLVEDRSVVELCKLEKLYRVFERA